MIPRSFNKTRIAPTPSGYLHLGNLASFILTCRLARRSGAEILLRIDDLDQQRVRREYLEDIFETLSFFELPIDLGPRSVDEHIKMYSQLHRRSTYSDLLQELVKRDLVFACECSRSSLSASEEANGYLGACKSKNIPLDTTNVNLRIKTESVASITLSDLKSDKKSYHFPKSMKDFVIRKKDGQAAYQLASVADDLFFGVDFIIRGEDLLDSTLAQLYISSQLANQSFSSATFFHHPLLRSVANQKLSKSAGDTSIMNLRKSGMTSLEILNVLGSQMYAQAEFSNWEELGDWLISSWVE